MTPRGLGHLGLAAISVLLFWAVGVTYLQSYDVVFHSTRLPRESVLAFNGLYTMFGLLGAFSLALGLGAIVADRQSLITAITSLWSAPSPRVWLIGTSALAFLLPVLAHHLLLRGMPLSDDEGVYHFAAQLLASGRLSVSSHPMATFFDHPFLINEGRTFTQYFLGWPALLAPGAALGVPWAMNPLYAAATVPPLYWIANRSVSASGARLATILYLVSPLVILLAATQLSHTSCLMWLTWTTYFTLRSTDEPAPEWTHAAVSLCFSAAFFTRPLTAVGIGIPLLLWWAWGMRHRRGTALASALALFCGPAALAAALFLASNHGLYGHPLKSGYSAYWDFLAEVDFRNSGWKQRTRDALLIPNLRFELDARQPGLLGAALYRLNYAWLGWPLSFLFVPFVRLRGEARLFAAMLLGLLGALYFSRDAGIDTLGPVHFSEAVLPLVLLSVAGWFTLDRWLASHAEAKWALRALVPALILVAGVCYLPVRLGAISEIATTLRKPHDVIARAELDQAIVFYKRAFARPCPAKHFVYGGPLNDPDLSGPVLYALDHGRARNRALLEQHFPTRSGYTLEVEKCKYQLRPL